MPARAAGRRGRPAPAAHARSRPRPQPARAPPRRRPRRPGPRRRDGDAVGGGPVGAARATALPAQARHRVGRTPASASARRARAPRCSRAPRRASTRCRASTPRTTRPRSPTPSTTSPRRPPRPPTCCSRRTSRRVRTPRSSSCAAFTAQSMTSLSDLDGRLPESAQDEYVHAVTTLMRIDDEARLSCPTCAGTDLDEIAPNAAHGRHRLRHRRAARRQPARHRAADPRAALARRQRPASRQRDQAQPDRRPRRRPDRRSAHRRPHGRADLAADRRTDLGRAHRAASPTAGLPTGVATSAAVVLPSVDLTQLLDDLTGGPSLLPVDPALGRRHPAPRRRRRHRPVDPPHRGHRSARRPARLTTDGTCPKVRRGLD